MGDRLIIMTCVSRSLRLEVGIVLRFFLEIYTLRTYAEGVSYAIREPKIRHVYGRQKKGFRKLNILHGSE